MADLIELPVPEPDDNELDGSFLLSFGGQRVRVTIKDASGEPAAEVIAFPATTDVPPKRRRRGPTAAP